MIEQHKPLILASGSEIRQKLLRQTGLSFDVIKANIDETAEKQNCTHMPPKELSAYLSEQKALSVSQTAPDAFVIGADQVCACEGRIYDKPYTEENAAATLTQLSGRTHTLHSGVCVARDGVIIWSNVETATMQMSVLIPSQIRKYVSADQPLSSAGSYKYESLGRYLFEQIDGTLDTIQGLPLHPLLKALREVDVYSF